MSNPVKSARFARVQSLLESVATNIAKFSNVIGEILKDRKIDFSEALELVAETATVKAIVNDAPLLAKQWRRLEESEKQEAAQIFAAQFDIPQDNAEKIVETIVTEGLRIEVAVTRIVQSVKTIRALFVSQPPAQTLPLETPADEKAVKTGK